MQSINPKQARTRLGLAIAVVVGCLWSSPNPVARGQDLQSLRDAVRSIPPPDPPSNNAPDRDDDHDHHHHHHGGRYRHHDDDDDDFTASAWAGLGVIIGTGITAPFWGPVVALNDSYDVPGYFPKYPYKGEWDGHMMLDPWIPEKPFPWSARVSVDHGTDFDATGNWTTKFLLETSTRWGIDSEVAYRSERLMPGVKDELYTGDLNLVMRFAQSERWQFRGGMGVNWLADGIDDEYGVNFTYGFDYYPGAPWVFSSEMDWGRLGNVHQLHLRSTAGVMYHGGELYIGVDYFDVGPVETTTMIGGLRIWF